jgi:hypothetical protein
MKPTLSLLTCSMTFALATRVAETPSTAPPSPTPPPRLSASLAFRPTPRSTTRCRFLHSLDSSNSVLPTRGRHALRAGIDFRWYQLNTVLPPNPTGSFAFTTTGTDQLGVTNSGNSIASFLLGQVDTFQIDLQTAKIRPRNHIQEYFVEDDWRATPRLTLNIGARWTLHFPSTEKNNQGAVFNLSTQQLDYLGVNGYPTHARERHGTNFAPRLGFTFLVSPKTVVRSGFGIVFIDQSGITTPFTTPQFPFIQSVTQKTQDSVNAAFKLSSGPSVAPIPLTPAAGLGQSCWPPPPTRTMASYPSSSIGGKTITNAQLLKPYPRFLNVATYRNNSGTTNYNALEAKVEQRLNHGIYLLFAYIHSKLIDDASSVFSSTVSSPNSSSLIAADTFRPYLERDSSNGDMPNVLTFSGIYDLPAGRGHPFASTGIANAALGGWSLNSIFQMQSGMPVTVTQATNNNAFAGFALQRPNLIANPSLAPSVRTPAHYFNTAAFATAPQFVIGKASRNPVRGPAYRDLDLALVKHTHLGEMADLEFRADVFDVTNTPAFAQPNGSFGSAAFGSITATTTDPRVAQFALRLSR